MLIIFAASAVGFFAGLFGIGGGLISVPCLFFIFETLNFDKNYLMHLTVGTAFTITIFTSTVSVMTHNKNKLVDHITIITSTLNSEKTIKRCLNSVYEFRNLTEINILKTL